MTDERLRVAACDPGWPAQFAAQRAVVERLLHRPARRQISALTVLP